MKGQRKQKESMIFPNFIEKEFEIVILYQIYGTIEEIINFSLLLVNFSPSPISFSDSLVS